MSTSFIYTPLDNPGDSGCGCQGPQGPQGPAGGGGGGGSDLYSNSTPTAVGLGGIAAGSTFASQTMQQMWDALLYPYQAPAFTSFSISGQPTSVEVGVTISGSKTFTWATGNSGNVQANSVGISDLTNSTPIASGLPNSGTATVSLPASVQKTSPGSNQWQISAMNTLSASFSATFTVNWYWRLYYGTSGNATLTGSQVSSLASNPLATSASGTYAYAAGGYKYLAFPTSFTAPSSFKDASTGFAMAMADSTDDASYSSIANGFSYATVSVTNAFSQATNYRVYRTKNTLGGSVSIQVS